MIYKDFFKEKLEQIYLNNKPFLLHLVDIFLWTAN